MFFDEDFLPHAYLDILLDPQELPISDLQSVSSSLLSKLDLYTDRLTRELEMTIQKLRKPTELLSYSSTYSPMERTTKLEYYLDTLGNSVKNLKDDIITVNKQLDELNSSSQESVKTAEAMRNLNTVKARLTQVSQAFEQLRSIVVISTEDKDVGEDGIPESISISSFKSSLKILSDLICSGLRELSENNSSSNNEELLRKVDYFVELRPVFKGLTKFNAAYGEFLESIREEADAHLKTKELDPSFS